MNDAGALRGFTRVTRVGATDFRVRLLDSDDIIFAVVFGKTKESASARAQKIADMYKAEGGC